MSIVIVLLEATSTVIVAFTMQRVAFEFQLTQYTNQTVLQMAVVRDQCLADDRIEVQKFESLSCPGQIRQFFGGKDRTPRHHCCSGRSKYYIFIILCLCARQHPHSTAH